MKIVHCFYTMEMGGAQVLAVDLMNRMCAHHQVNLVVVNNVYSDAVLSKLDKRIGVHLIRRKEGSRNPWPLIKLNLLLRRLNPDVIHCHEPDIGRILKVGKIKMLYTIHDVGIPTTHYHYYKTLVAISDAVYTDVAGRYQRPIAKVYNGVDAAPFTKRKDYTLASPPLRLVQLSRLMHEKKGQDILLQALGTLKQQYGKSLFTVDFIGGGASLEHLKQLADSLGLSADVTFAGERDRDWLYQNLSQYHLLVQPSRYEGFGLTILEGFAAGLPVLVSDIEGPAEIISRTPRGYLFRNGDVPHCAERLYHIFKQYEDGAIAELMMHSKSITDKEYSVDACVSGYLQEYEALAAASI